MPTQYELAPKLCTLELIDMEYYAMQDSVSTSASLLSRGFTKETRFLGEYILTPTGYLKLISRAADLRVAKNLIEQNCVVF